MALLLPINELYEILLSCEPVGIHKVDNILDDQGTKNYPVTYPHVVQTFGITVKKLFFSPVPKSFAQLRRTVNVFLIVGFHMLR